MFSTIYLRLEGKVPPPRNEKLGIHVKVTFWFRLMYPPLENGIGPNMNAIGKKSFQVGSSSRFYNLPSPPPLPGPYLILCMHRKIVHFDFKWIFENLNFWFSDDSDIRVI